MTLGETLALAFAVLGLLIFAAGFAVGVTFERVRATSRRDRRARELRRRDDEGMATVREWRP